MNDTSSETPAAGAAPGGDPAADLPRRRRRTPYSFLFRLLHWALLLSMPVLILSGLSLHAAARPDWSLFSGRVPSWFWTGRVNLVHIWAALVFFPSLVAVLWISARRRSRWRATHLVLLGGGLVMIASAQVLLGPFGPATVYSTARLIHAVVGLVVLPIALVWHVVDGLGRFRGLLIPALHPWARPSLRQLVFFIPVPLVTTCLILGGLPIEPAWRQLNAKRLPTAEKTVVDLAALPWNEAQPLRIELGNGAGFYRGRTRVTLRALHDGRELFVLAEWADPIEDRRYMPWRKTAEGWQRMMTDESDESVYYEDKFGLAFPTEPDWQFRRFGCAIYCHLGGGRAYGYKGSEEIVDVWHWKSTRADPVGQVDDKYWWEVDLSAPAVGRHGDPKDGGGYKKNASTDKTHPAFLPDHPSAVRQGIIPSEHAREYHPQLAEEIPVGTIVPGIVAAAAGGDRGQVACRSEHGPGGWRVLIRRKLDTGSRYDVKFVPGGRYAFGCAAFDRTSKRHAYGLGVYRLTLEE